jgi:hypothetical protein
MTDPTHPPLGPSYCMFPIRLPQVWSMYKVRARSFWRMDNHRTLGWDSSRTNLLHQTRSRFHGIVNDNLMEQHLRRS